MDKKETLTKKNQTYLHQVTKLLTNDGSFSEEVINQHVQTIQSALLEHQKNGVTAVQQFGSPTEYIDHIKHPNKKSQTTATPKKRTQQINDGKNIFDYSFNTLAIDTILSVFILFAGFYGLMGLISNQNSAANQAPLGVVSMILVSVLSGYAYTYILRSVTANPKTGEQKNIWVRIGFILGGVIGWSLLFVLIALLPRIVNPALPAVVMIVLAAIAWVYLNRYRKQSQINGGFIAVGQLATRASVAARNIRNKNK